MDSISDDTFEGLTDDMVRIEVDHNGAANLSSIENVSSNNNGNISEWMKADQLLLFLEEGKIRINRINI